VESSSGAPPSCAALYSTDNFLIGPEEIDVYESKLSKMLSDRGEQLVAPPKNRKPGILKIFLNGLGGREKYGSWYPREHSTQQAGQAYDGGASKADAEKFWRQEVREEMCTLLQETG
jgi:hypothetical protein